MFAAAVNSNNLSLHFTSLPLPAFYQKYFFSVRNPSSWLDRIALARDLIQNVVDEAYQLIFKDNDKSDKYDHKISPLSGSPHKHWLYHQRHCVASVFFLTIFRENCVHRALGRTSKFITLATSI